MYRRNGSSGAALSPAGTLICAAAEVVPQSRIPLFRRYRGGMSGPASKSEIVDTLGRPIRDLRISVTDKCNFRCVYCMPKEIFGRGYQFLQKGDLLTYEELERLVRIFVGLGVEKVRLTGGEPLLRRGVETLVGMLAGVNDLDLTLTTNGSVLEQTAQALKDAGLKRITVSLDSLDDATFRKMNDVDFPVEKVLRAMDRAHEVGLRPVKVNMVVRRGMNEDSVVPMA